MKTSNKTLLSVLVLAIGVTLMGQMVKAQEMPEPRMMAIRGGVMCNTQTELETLLTAYHFAGNKQPAGEDIPKGCGRFMPRSPIPMLVTPMGWYTTPSVDTLIAKFHHAQSGWTQYGWIAYKPNPDYVPEPKRDPA